MSIVRPFTALSFAWFIAACSAVVTDRPLGDEAYALGPTELEGAWYIVEDEPGPFFARVLGPGLILAASVEENDGGFELEEVVLHIRTTEGRLYLSGLVEDESKERYFFALLAKKGDVLIAEAWGRHPSMMMRPAPPRALAS